MAQRVIRGVCTYPTDKDIGAVLRSVDLSDAHAKVVEATVMVHSVTQKTINLQLNLEDSQQWNLQPKDYVTHFNGEPFLGTAFRLSQMIKALKPSDKTRTFTIGYARVITSGDDSSGTSSSSGNLSSLMVKVTKQRRGTCNIQRVSPGDSFGIFCGEVGSSLRIVALSEPASSSKLRPGDIIISVNGKKVLGCLKVFCSEANRSLRSIRITFKRDPLPKAHELVGKIFRLQSKPSMCLVVCSYRVRDKKHLVSYFGERACEWLSIDREENVDIIPAGACHHHVSVVLVENGNLYRAESKSGMCSLFPPNKIIVEHAKGNEGIGSRFYQKITLSHSMLPLLQSQNMLVLVSDDSRKMCLVFENLEACEVFCTFARAYSFPVHRCAGFTPPTVKAPELSKV